MSNHGDDRMACRGLFPLYRDIALSIVELNPMLLGLLLMAFEIAMGLLPVPKRKSVSIGLEALVLDFLPGRGQRQPPGTTRS